MKIVRRNRNFISTLQRNKLIILLIALMLTTIFYKLFSNYKIVREKIKITKGTSLKNFKNEEGKLNLTSNQNIFFIDDDPGDEKILKDGRKACSIESAALMNPNMTVYFNLLTTTDKLFLHESKISLALQSYKNIKIRYINFHDYCKNSILFEWLNSDPFWTYSVDQVADVIKMLILYKHGGISMNFNTILIKSFKEINFENFACALDKNSIFPSMIKLSNSESGQKFSDAFFLKIQKSFEIIPSSDEQEKVELNLKQSYFNDDQGAPVPSKLFTKVIKNACLGRSFSINQTTNCDGFHVLPVTHCTPAFERNFRKFFHERNLRFVMDKLKSALLVHLWSDAKVTKTIEVKSRAAFGEIVRKFCPKVSKVLKNI